MRVRVNGGDREVPEGLTVAALLRHLGLEGRPVAVERNREIVRRDLHDAVRVCEGDSFEIVQFVGGG